MPELPEVTTTVNGLNKVLPKLSIQDVWSDYFISTANKRTDNIKNKKFFEKFKKEITGEKFIKAERRAKNILIHLSNNKTILIHMKMTGHLLYGKYERVASNRHLASRDNTWKALEPETLKDPFSRFIHLVFTLSDGKHLAFSDMRKFAKVTILETKNKKTHIDLVNLGPEPLQDFSATDLEKQLAKKPNGRIKTVLMDQSIIAGIGNIYSDEILWQANIHPERLAGKISKQETKNIWKAMIEILNKSIKMGGDSMSDYRNINGEKGDFQNAHKVYKRKGEICLKKRCSGIIKRKIIDGRSAHFCDKHQK